MIDFLASLQILNEEELQNLPDLLQEKTLKKNGFLIQPGQVASEIVFIKSGILRSYYIHLNGDEITNCITFAGELMSAYSSFISQAPTEESIQALVETELLVLGKEDLEKLYEQSSRWQNVGRLLSELQYMELEKRILSLQKQNAKQRYQQLLQNHPNYLKFIPQNHLASFLGISPRHLSRLRKEF